MTTEQTIIKMRIDQDVHDRVVKLAEKEERQVQEQYRFIIKQHLEGANEQK